MRIVIATSNRGKLAEFAALLPPWMSVEGLDAHPRVVLPEETGTTYAENAVLKAEAAMRATGLPSLGDDSGLEVRALGGQPGLFSARFARTRLADESQDEANRRVLLEALARSGVPESDWDARFVCALAFAVPNEAVHVFQGEAEGAVVAAPRGAGGFGYDPIVVLGDGRGKTFAELRDEEKNAASHRGKAVRAFLAGLKRSG